MSERIQIVVPSSYQRLRSQVTWRADAPIPTMPEFKVVELEVLQRNHAQGSTVVRARPCGPTDAVLVVANEVLARDPFAVWLESSRAILDERAALRETEEG